MRLARLLLPALLLLLPALAAAQEAAPRGARHGLLGGLAISAVLIAIGAADDAQGRCGDCYVSATAISGILGVALTTTTTVGGAVLGAALPGEHWVRVRTPVVLAPARP